MLRARSLVMGAAVAAALVAPASAQSSKVNGIPVSEFEVGALVWYSASKFKVDLYDTTGASQVSRLTFDGAKTGTAEINFKLSGLSSGAFFRGAGGFGMNFGGNLTDEDFSNGFAPGYASTNSELSTKSMYYFGADVGWTAPFLQDWRMKISPYLGVFYLRDTFNAKGLSCNTASTGSLAGYCPATGATFGISSDTDVIKNDITFWGPRVGANLSWDITRQVSLGLDAAYLFLGNYKNEDSHFLRQAPFPAGLGPVPNFVDTSKKGSGTQLQATLDYKFADSGWTVGIGARWWQFKSGDAAATTPNAPYVDQISRNTLDIYGGFLRANYGF